MFGLLELVEEARERAVGWSRIALWGSTVLRLRNRLCKHVQCVANAVSE